MDHRKVPVPEERIGNRILIVRGQRVILDADLAEFYGVATKRLNEQVKRNRRRFPDDFVFVLTPKEKAEVVAKCDHLSKLKFAKALPLAFTEHGSIMAASVLSTPRAVDMSVFVVRAFVRLRQSLSESEQLGERLRAVEERVALHDQRLASILRAIRHLLGPREVPERRRIGFR